MQDRSESLSIEEWLASTDISADQVPSEQRRAQLAPFAKAEGLGADFLIHCRQLYQAVCQHPKADSVLYRLNELDKVSVRALETSFQEAGEANVVGHVQRCLVHVRRRIIDNTCDRMTCVFADGATLENMLQDRYLESVLNHAVSAESKAHLKSEMAKVITGINNKKMFMAIEKERGSASALLEPLFEQIAQRHALMRDFFGQERFRLTATDGIYKIGAMHTLEKNTVWIFANIKAGRPFHIRSKVNGASILRQPGHAHLTPSAFANEISMLMVAGYDVGMSNGDFILRPPEKPNDVLLADLQCDMRDLSARMTVLSNVAKFLDQAMELRATSSSSSSHLVVSSDDLLALKSAQDDVDCALVDIAVCRGNENLREFKHVKADLNRYHKALAEIEPQTESFSVVKGLAENIQSLSAELKDFSTSVNNSPAEQVIKKSSTTVSKLTGNAMKLARDTVTVAKQKEEQQLNNGDSHSPTSPQNN